MTTPTTGSGTWVSVLDEAIPLVTVNSKGMRSEYQDEQATEALRAKLTQFCASVEAAMTALPKAYALLEKINCADNFGECALLSRDGMALLEPLLAAYRGEAATPKCGECAKCGAPTDPDYGHVGDCKPATPAKGGATDNDLAKGLRETAQRLEGLFGGQFSEWHGRARECRRAADILTATPSGGGDAPRVFVDLDGVIVDFDRFRDERGLTGDQVKAMPGAYLDMPPIPGAVEAVRSLIGMGYEVWLATKPPTGIPHAYSDKAAWVMEHLPELKRRIIITHDKGLLGCEGDYLCDDRPHKANCERFRGTLVRFVDGYHWPQALDLFRARRGRRHASTGSVREALNALLAEAVEVGTTCNLAAEALLDAGQMATADALSKGALTISKLAAALSAQPATGSVPAPSGDDTKRLDWLEQHEASLVTHREFWTGDEYSVWWNVAKGDQSISGHPLGDARGAIDAAMSAAPTQDQASEGEAR